MEVPVVHFRNKKQQFSVASLLLDQLFGLFGRSEPIAYSQNVKEFPGAAGHKVGYRIALGTSGAVNTRVPYVVQHRSRSQLRAIAGLPGIVRIRVDGVVVAYCTGIFRDEVGIKPDG